MTTFLEHADHGEWKKIGACVYCACDARLYQAKKLPKDRHALAEALDGLTPLLQKRVADGAP